MKITQVEWVTVGKEAIKDYGKDDIAGLAAEMAYWIIFSLFPFFIFMATLTGIINRFTGTDLYKQITEGLFSALEPSTAQTIQRAFDDHPDLVHQILDAGIGEGRFGDGEFHNGRQFFRASTCLPGSGERPDQVVVLQLVGEKVGCTVKSLGELDEAVIRPGASYLPGLGGEPGDLPKVPDLGHVRLR